MVISWIYIKSADASFPVSLEPTEKTTSNPQEETLCAGVYQLPAY